MAALTKMLLDENRMDDLRKCTEDVAYRNQLLQQLQRGSSDSGAWVFSSSPACQWKHKIKDDDIRK